MDPIHVEKLLDNSETTINSQQVETLKKHFPQCFDKHGRFMPEKLNEIVSDSGTAFSKESYSLNWLGKSYARLLANEHPLTLMAEDKEHNQKPENQSSENLLIKGDNLEVLKHLKGAYSESVKMIYIDPPYNTGSDGFVYQDDRKFTPKALATLAGIDEEEAKRILEFTQSRANSHSAWLTFMYPRLYIARDLLKEDGVIFISIDDNEMAQLKILCDEIFGEQNFVANIIWEKKYTRANDARWFSDNHDYILCYAKSLDCFQIHPLPRNDSQLKAYQNPDNHPKGAWKATPLHAKSGTNTASYTFSNGVVFTPPRGTFRRYNDETMREMERNNEIWFGKDGQQVPQKKSFLSEVKTGVTPVTIWKYCEVGHNHEATTDLENLNMKGFFASPKPVRLIQQMLKLATNIKDEGLVMDFFAGSGTTAHAVMALNQADGGNRKFICVQLPETVNKKHAAYKAGYKTIFDITKARIEKAAEKIRSEDPEYGGDLGFKIFETLPIFEGYLENIERLEGEQTELFDGSTLSDEQLDALLTTWQVYDGIPLTQVLVEVDLAGYTAYRQRKVLYLMHQGFSTEALKAFLTKLDATDGEDKSFDVEKLVIFGYNFESKHLLEINEAVRQYQNRKEKTVSVVVRY